MPLSPHPLGLLGRPPLLRSRPGHNVFERVPHDIDVCNHRGVPWPVIAIHLQGEKEGRSSADKHKASRRRGEDLFAKEIQGMEDPVDERGDSSKQAPVGRRNSKGRQRRDRGQSDFSERYVQETAGGRRLAEGPRVLPCERCCRSCRPPPSQQGRQHAGCQACA